jgi:hypothetical protein
MTTKTETSACCGSNLTLIRSDQHFDSTCMVITDIDEYECDECGMVQCFYEDFDARACG